VQSLNRGILAHVDAGKTSPTERLLHHAGVIDEVGSVDRGSTRTDTLALERERGITIESAVVSFVAGDVAINLIDTPGHPDFIAEVERVLSVLDGAVLVVSAVEGVQAQTRVLMRALQRLRIPTLVFVNKVDRAGARADAWSRRSPSGSRRRSCRWGRRCARARAPPATSRTRAPMRASPAGGARSSPSTTTRCWPPTSTTPRTFRTRVCAARRPPRPSGHSRTRCCSARRPPARGRPPSSTRSAGCSRRPRASGATASGPARSRGCGTSTTSASAMRSARRRTGAPPAWRFALPTLETVVVPRGEAEHGAPHVALERLTEQDPLINLRHDDARREASLSLYGEVQKEVIRATLARDFGLDVAFRASTAICVERLTATGAAVEVIDTDGNPFLGTVGLRLDPAPPGAGTAFGLEVELGSMPYAFFRGQRARGAARGPARLGGPGLHGDDDPLGPPGAAEPLARDVRQEHVERGARRPPAHAARRDGRPAAGRDGGP
jgi:ribosomal protection tetracycline resistance protein